MKIPFSNLLIGALLIIIVFLLGSYFPPNTLFNNLTNILKTSSPKPTIIPTTIIYSSPTSDPEPIIKCNISSNCGGGFVELRQSICNNSTCCHVGNKWVFYQDKTQCVQTAGNNTVQQNVIPSPISKVPVFLTSVNKTINCTPESVDAIKSGDLALKESNSSYANCLGNVGTSYNKCSYNCYNAATWSECVELCRKAYNSDGCIKPNSDSLQSLISKYCQ